MAQVELIMPKMGESIMEATILQWVKKEGDRVEIDETVLEISTDKVDSEVPSPVEGILKKILFQPSDVVAIGQALAIIEVEGTQTVVPSPSQEKVVQQVPSSSSSEVKKTEKKKTPIKSKPTPAKSISDSGSFFSPLVRNMAKEESISMSELEKISGSGKNGRVTKADMLAYIERRKEIPQPLMTSKQTSSVPVISSKNTVVKSAGENVEIIEMSRMRKLISKHMTDSKNTAAHVTSFTEVDVTPIVEWRNSVKDPFFEKYGEKITFTPIFMDAVIQGIKAYPMINSSVSGDKIVIKKDINLGMATAMENGNLIVPVIKNADYLNMVGMAKTVNDLARRARENQLKPDEIQGGTFTMTNVGTFGSMMGTPIINQPQVAILAVGVIKKKPVVLETSQGDVIGIRHMMFMSLSYDHRIIDGALGSLFLKKVGDTLESFTPNEI